MSQLTLYNAARPPPGPPELRRLRSVGRVPPPGILRRFTPARNRTGSGPFCILHSAFFLSPIRPRDCGHSGSRGDCRLKAATQERRLQAADGLHNPPTPSRPPQLQRLRLLGAA